MDNYYFEDEGTDMASYSSPAYQDEFEWNEREECFSKRRHDADFQRGPPKCSHYEKVCSEISNAMKVLKEEHLNDHEIKRKKDYVNVRINELSFVYSDNNSRLREKILSTQVRARREFDSIFNPVAIKLPIQSTSSDGLMERREIELRTFEIEVVQVYENVLYAMDELREEMMEAEYNVVEDRLCCLIDRLRELDDCCDNKHERWLSELENFLLQRLRSFSLHRRNLRAKEEARMLFESESELPRTGSDSEDEETVITLPYSSTSSDEMNGIRKIYSSGSVNEEPPESNKEIEVSDVASLLIPGTSNLSSPSAKNFFSSFQSDSFSPHSNELTDHKDSPVSEALIIPLTNQVRKKKVKRACSKFSPNGETPDLFGDDPEDRLSSNVVNFSKDRAPILGEPVLVKAHHEMLEKGGCNCDSVRESDECVEDSNETSVVKTQSQRILSFSSPRWTRFNLKLKRLQHSSHRLVHRTPRSRKVADLMKPALYRIRTDALRGTVKRKILL